MLPVGEVGLGKPEKLSEQLALEEDDRSGAGSGVE